MILSEETIIIKFNRKITAFSFSALQNNTQNHTNSLITSKLTVIE